MYMNCWIHCCTSALLRSQIFRLVLLSFARNSWALGGGMPTEDLDGAVLAPATWEGRGWGHVRATNKIKQCNPRIYIQISSSGDCLLPLVSWHLVFLLPASKMFHKESRLSPSLLLRILCRLLVPDTSVRDSRQTAHHMSPPPSLFAVTVALSVEKNETDGCDATLFSSAWKLVLGTQQVTHQALFSHRHLQRSTLHWG